jgi:hypothetical protein
MVQHEVREIMAGYAGLAHAGEDRVNADPFVIALARGLGVAVVSEERRSGNPDTPKIPNVCAARGVPLRPSTGAIRVRDASALCLRSNSPERAQHYWYRSTTGDVARKPRKGASQGGRWQIPVAVGATCATWRDGPRVFRLSAF